MPRFRSVAGKWFPAKELYINDKAEDPSKAVYEGPDRAAKEILDAQGIEFLGQDCRLEESTTIKARNLGLDDADEYLKKYKNIDLKDIEAKQGYALETEVHHANRNEIVRKPAIQPRSGGEDTSGQGKHRKGGFGSPDDVDVGNKRM